MLKSKIHEKRKNSLLVLLFLIIIVPMIGSTLLIDYANAQTTPYQVTGQIQITDTKYHIIYGVNIGDIVLVNVDPIDANPAYYSSVYYPNMTVLQKNFR